MKRLFFALAICALPNLGRGAILSSASLSTDIDIGDYRGPTTAITFTATVKTYADIGHNSESPLSKRVASGASPYDSYLILMTQDNSKIQPICAIGQAAGFVGNAAFDFPNFSATGPHVISCTWSQNGTLDMYIDGIFRAGAVDHNQVISYDGTGTTKIAHNLTDGTYFGGEISDVAIWDVRLSTPQMQTLGQMGVRRALHHGLPKPLRYYPLDTEAPAYTTISNTPMNIYGVIGSSNASTSGKVLFVGSRQPIP